MLFRSWKQAERNGRAGDHMIERSSGLSTLYRMEEVGVWSRVAVGLVAQEIARQLGAVDDENPEFGVF